MNSSSIPPIPTFVHAHSLADAIVAFAVLEQRLESSPSLECVAAHGGCLAAAWALTGVRIEQIAAAIITSTTPFEVAELTLDDTAHTALTSAKLHMIMSRGNAWTSSNEEIVHKWRYGCHRDLCEAVSASCMLPCVTDGVCSHQLVSIHNSSSRHKVLPTPRGDDINMQLHSSNPQCMRSIPKLTVEAVCGLYYIAKQTLTAAQPPPVLESSETLAADRAR